MSYGSYRSAELNEPGTSTIKIKKADIKRKSYIFEKARVKKIQTSLQAAYYLTPE